MKLVNEVEMWTGVFARKPSCIGWEITATVKKYRGEV